MNLPQQFSIPCAWKGRELAGQPERWIKQLSKVQLAELDNAIAVFRDQDADIKAISPQTFPLPTLRPELNAIREQLQTGLGFVLIRGLDITHYDVESCCILFCGIGSYLGVARSQNASGHLLGHVCDVGGDLNDSRVRIYQTAKRQSFHTDSCDAVGLLCLQEAMQGGDSLLAATHTLYNEMQKRRPDLVPFLFEPIATDRRGEIPVGQKPYFLIPVLNWYQDKLTGLYQRNYIRSAARFDDAPVPDSRHVEALDLLDEIAEDPSIHLRMRLQPGDIQFVYNHTNLHDRTEFIDWPDSDKRRHLLRLWLSLPDDRELPEAFKQRYGSITVGDRGGIIVDGTALNVPLQPAAVC